MSTQSKINIFLAVLVISLLLSVGVLGKLAWDQHELAEANTRLNEQLMAANLEIGKAETRFGKIEAELSKELSDWIARYDEQIDAYGELQARYDVLAEGPAERIVYVTGTSVHAEEDVVPGIYVASDSTTLKALPEGISISEADHRIHIDSKVWSENFGEIVSQTNYRLHMLFSGELIKTSTQSGAINYYLNLWEIGPEGKQLGKMELESFVITTIDERAPEFFWWAPHLDISGFAGLGAGLVPQYGAAIGFSVMGYGLTENDLQLRLVNVSMDLGSSLGVGLTPIQYNLGHHIPIISNLWLGPHVGYNINQEWYLGLALGAVL